jgi:nucleotide-binding universal stress UspA family protein
MRWAAHLAELYPAEIVVMTGFVPTESELPPQRVEALLAEQQQRLETWSNTARLGDVRVQTVVERGDPRQGILRVADREQADLVVVGRIGQSAGPGLLHFGSVAEWLAHNSHVPVAVVGGAVSIPVRSVLVGADGSPGSRAALRWVRGLAAVADVRIVVASVDQGTPATSPEKWQKELEDRIREELAGDLTAAGLDFEAVALQGANAADALLQTAKDERTDVVVVGARGLGGFTGLRIGGVALKTLHRSDRPVVLIPADTQT